MVEPGASSEAEAGGSHGDSKAASSSSISRGLNLLGSFTHAIDEKRRVAIPRPIRDQAAAAGLRDAWVVCRSLGGDRCLELFPADRFAARLQKLETMREQSMGVGSKPIRAYLRHVRETASEQVPDKQGRIVLNEDQCKLAELGAKGEAVFLGAGESVEMWSRSVLERVRAADDFEAMARQIFG